MTLIRKFTMACVVAAAAALPLAAQAQGPVNQDTYFTFSAPVELPGVTLPAGRYLFVLADSPSNRHVVRVMSDDRKKLFTTLMAIPSYTLGKPSEDPEIRFMEGPENAPNAVKIWIYPGRTVGHEFLYPRSQATRLARASGESVLTVKTEDATLDTVVDTDMTRIDQEGRDAAISADTITLEADADAARGTVDAEASVQAEAAPALNGNEPTAERTELPSTATMLPLIGLIGLGSLAAGAWMRRSRRSSASSPRV